MKKTGMLMGLCSALLGLCVIFTPMRIYFLLGWVTGIPFLCHGITMVAATFFSKSPTKSKVIHGIVTSLVGVALIGTDIFQILTQQLIIFLVAGGILISGLIECFVGYTYFKYEKKGLMTLVMGIASCIVGIAGIVFQETTVTVIGCIVGFFFIKIGASLFTYARDYDKPRVIDL